MKRISWIIPFCFLIFFSFLCADAKENGQNTAEPQIQNTEHDKTWDNLHARLVRDGFSEKDLEKYFLQLQNAFSQKPMGNKVKELYQANFAPKKPSKKKPGKQKPKTNALGVPYPWYDGYVTKENALKCKNFLDENEEYFILAEKKYAVPKEIISALIYVETWHGKFLGKFTPLSMLASMSISTELSMLPNYTKNLSLTAKQEKFLHEKINARADWAYEELKALLRYSIQNDMDISKIPSSIYGAIGYGQFMPSNIKRFGVDADNDGKINLFEPADAILSVANFLHKQGWKQKNIAFKNQVKILKRYNYSTAYAHTILALAKLSRQTAAPQAEAVNIAQKTPKEKNNVRN